EPGGDISIVTDLPTTVTWAHIGARVKRVVDYIGAPAALKEFERHIDEAAGTQRWISVTPDVVRELQRDGWNAASQDGVKWLRDAVHRADVETAQALLDAGADPNDGNVPA